MKVMVIAETFLPLMNGVTNSVLHTLQYLRRRGDKVLVVAPSISFLDPHAVAHQETDQFELCHGFPVVRVPSLPLPEYRSVRVCPGSVTRLRHLMRRFAPDVVHIASPFVLGWRAIQAAQSLHLPTVSVYQTEVPHYASRYRIPWARELLWQHVQRMHNNSTLTLAPSSFCKDQLLSRGIRRVKIWGRGVDHQQFSPSRRSEQLRAELAPQGEKLIGFVGRLAAEKQIEDLAVLDDLPGTRLVIIGTGPAEAALRRRLRRAHFAGFRSGAELGTYMASLDVFVHPGEAETFCQTIQEAMAAGVPVVAVARGGPLDLVQPGGTGWLYPPGDLTALAQAVRQLSQDTALAEQFSARCGETVRERSWEAVCNQLIGHYARAIETNQRMRQLRGTRATNPPRRLPIASQLAHRGVETAPGFSDAAALGPDEYLRSRTTSVTPTPRMGVSSVL